MLKILGLLVTVIVMMSTETFAITFHQPIEIGRIMFPPTGNIIIEQAVRSNGKQIYGSGKKIYEIDYENKGFAQFGNTENAIFFHYMPHKQPLYGGENQSNTFQVKSGLYGDTIYQIRNESENKIYILMNNEAMEGFRNYTCLGRRKDSKFVKYFDTDEIKRRYFGSSDWNNIRNGKLPYFKKIYCKDDVIIIEYERFQKQQAPIKEGEFRFKWDDKAKWFGIEQVVY